MNSPIATRELTDGYTVSRIIKGGWQLSEGHSLVDKRHALDDMFAFVEAGFTTFDCADIYTGVEELIGNFLVQYRKKFGEKEAENIHVHTKFVPDIDALPSLSKQNIEAIIDRSLKRLHGDQLHLVQFHWWDYDVPRYVETALVLKELQRKGKILHLAGTNFDVRRLKEITDAGVKFVSLQVQYSVLDQRPENGMVEYCKQNNIKFICYGKVAGGFLSDKYLGQSEPLESQENRSLIKYKLIIDEAGGWNYFQSLLQTLHMIAKKHGVSITNVATRYVLEKPNVAAIVIGARNTKNLQANLHTFDFQFDHEDRIHIEKIIAKSKGSRGDIYSLERVKGGKHAGIMKYKLNKE